MNCSIAKAVRIDSWYLNNYALIPDTFASRTFSIFWDSFNFYDVSKFSHFFQIFRIYRLLEICYYYFFLEFFPVFKNYYFVGILRFSKNLNFDGFFFFFFFEISMRILVDFFIHGRNLLIFEKLIIYISFESPPHLSKMVLLNLKIIKEPEGTKWKKKEYTRILNFSLEPYVSIKKKSSSTKSYLM